MDSSSNSAARLRAAFPSAAAADVDLALGIVEESSFGPTDHDIGPVVVNGEPRHIPHRIYSPAPAPRSLALLTDPARTVIHCLLTRHHDGHVREAHLRKIVSSPRDWVPPFVVQLLGEYVTKIHDVVLENVGHLSKESDARFASENPGFMTLTRQRAISYWNCYYRQACPALHVYVAYRILEVLSPPRAKPATRRR